MAAITAFVSSAFVPMICYPLYEIKIRRFLLRDTLPVVFWTHRWSSFVPAFVGNALETKIQKVVRRQLETICNSSKTEKVDNEIGAAMQRVVAITTQPSNPNILSDLLNELCHVMEVASQQLNFSSICIRAFSALSAAALVYPLYLVTTKIISSHDLRTIVGFVPRVHFIRDMISGIYITRGLAGFYEGVLPLLGNRLVKVGAWAVSAVAFKCLAVGGRRVLQANPQVQPILVPFATGVGAFFGGTILGIVVGHPLGLWSVQLRAGLAPFANGKYSGLLMSILLPNYDI